MNGAATSERERAVEGVTRLSLAQGPLLRPVLCRVVSIVLARAEWPLDRLEDALLVCDALCASGAGEQRLTFSFEADERAAQLRVCELEPAEAERLVREANLPLVGNVLERVAQSVGVKREQGNQLARLEIALSAS